MKTNFTDGEFEMRGNRIFVKDTFNSIATIHVQKNYEDITFKPIEDVEAIANGKLFVASKDLLESLQDLVWLVEQGATIEELQESISFKAKKAIKKAL